jgi:uncharacterized radical SAM superfamily Fe-S cluster-containing enzyme
MGTPCCPADGDSTFLSVSKGMCRQCHELVEVRYLAGDDGRVYLERCCPTHGISRALVAESLAWYLDAMQAPVGGRSPSRVTERRSECPRDCGPCTFHAQACNLPVFSITNACDLRCPICFTYNRDDRVYHMSADEFDRHIDFVIEATGGVDLINITGGEPTMHPELLDLLERAKRPEIGRVTLNTNGLRLAREPDLVRALADMGVYVVLSLDSFEPERCERIHGRDIGAEKRQALEQLERFGVPTTLLMVLIGGVNEDELPQLLDLLYKKDFVRSLTIQTMTYTGQGGGAFEPRVHIPVDGVERRIQEASAGRIGMSDFVPMPTAHPLCYGVSYLATDGQGGVHPFTRLLDSNELSKLISDGYLLHPTDEMELQLKQAIDRLWSEGQEPGLLKTLKSILRSVYPPGETLSMHERQAKAEQMVKTIYVHAHMDEDTWEVGRAMRCPDQVPVHAERLIGACNYNLFYRQADERFWVDS